jgi:Poly(ADP-ribose) polymerase catalytic domain
MTNLLRKPRGNVLLKDRLFQDTIKVRLVGWVLRTFDGVLLPLDTSGFRAAQGIDWPGNWKLYLVQTGNRKRAADFKEGSLQWTSASPGRKSEFFYHGSFIGNWHSILRQDIQICGPQKGVSGSGVYMTDDVATACNYCRPGHSGFSLEDLKAKGNDLDMVQCVGLLEVVGAAAHWCDPFEFIVAPKRVQYVTVRALVVITRSLPVEKLPGPQQVGAYVLKMQEYC